MKRVITAAVLIPLVFLLVLKGSFLCWWSQRLWSPNSPRGNTSPSPMPTARRTSGSVGHRGSLRRHFPQPRPILPAIGLCSLVLLIVCSFRSPLERVLPDAAFSVFGLLYIGLTLATLPLVWAQPEWPLAVDLPVLRRLDRRCCRPLRRPHLRTPQAGAANQSEQDLGGERRFARRQPAHCRRPGRLGAQTADASRSILPARWLAGWGWPSC